MTETRRGPQRRIVLPRLARPDFALLLSTGLLVAFGLVMVFNASYFYAQDRFQDPMFIIWKHVVAIVIGTIGLLVLMRMRAETFERLARPCLILGFLLLLAVLLPGVGINRGGAQRWLYLGGFSLQPAELVKPVVVAYLASSIARKGERMQTAEYGLVPHLVVVGLCSLLIGLQPDFGTAALLWMLLVAMLFVGGARLRHVATLGAVSIVGFLAAAVIVPYRLRRLLSFLDPWEDLQGSGFQLVQSFIAFASGGVFGNGLAASKQRFFLPEVHTDFMFALIGEEVGLVGAAAVLVLFAVVGIRGFRIAMRHPEPFGSLLAFGVTASLLLSAFVNVGVVLGLLPTKGLPLPFLSYGGSAMIGALAHVGVLAALSRTTG